MGNIIEKASKAVEKAAESSGVNGVLSDVSKKLGLGGNNNSKPKFSSSASSKLDTSKMSLAQLMELPQKQMPKQLNASQTKEMAFKIFSGAQENTNKRKSKSSVV